MNYEEKKFFFTALTELRFKEFARILNFYKGQLISNGHFGVFNSSKKTKLKTLIFALAKDLWLQMDGIAVNGLIILKYWLQAYWLFTPPRLSEISMTNWRAKVKPVLTPHLWCKAMLKVWIWWKSWEPFRNYQLTSTANLVIIEWIRLGWLCQLVGRS